VTLLATHEATPLRRWDGARRAALARALSDALGRWCSDWDVEASPADQIGFDDAPSLAWRAVAPGLWWAMAGEPQAALASALFGEPPAGLHRGGRLADQLAGVAWDDWWGSVCTALDLPDPAGVAMLADAVPDDAAPQALRHWRGGLALGLPWCGQRLMLLIDGDRVARWMADRGLAVPAAARAAPPTVPVLHALAARNVALRVELAPFEIDFGSLAGLRVGDVLDTGHALDRPLHVQGATASACAAPVCDAWLGRQERRVVVELAARAAAPRR
jgi:hypothetical protein